MSGGNLLERRIVSGINPASQPACLLAGLESKIPT